MEPNAKIETVEVHVELPEELVRKREGSIDREDLVLTLAAGVASAWVPVGIMPANSRRQFSITGIPGFLPVSCCFTEWDVTRNRPFFGSAIFILDSIQRADGTVRVEAQLPFGTPLNAAVGIIFTV